MIKTGSNEKSIGEIESKLSVVGGDMLKIEYLENALKKDLPMEVRKYVHIKISDLYIKRLMIGVAAKNLEGAAEIAQTFKEKKELYMRQAQLLIKNLGFDEAEKAFKKALTCTNTNQEKEELKLQYKNHFLEKALELEKSQNLKKASGVYEKVLSLEPQNLDVKKKLAYLYLKVGKIRESIAMEQTIKSPKVIEPPKKEFNIDELFS